MNRVAGFTLLALALFASASCASLGRLGAAVLAPRWESAEGHQAELRLLGPGPGRRFGGAAIRLWAKVKNPNFFSLTIDALDGTLFLEDNRAARAEFPLGLPLRAGEESIIPLDVSVDFSDLPRLAEVMTRAVGGSPVGYRLEGTITVDAGPLGHPSFGPATLLNGDVRVLR